MTRPILAAFTVHIFTASGTAFALLALLAAAQANWAMMFAWLGAALVVDAVDGTMARRLKSAELLPRWSGDVLDLVVDFATYVLVPAFAIATGGLLPDLAAIPLGVVITIAGALYFADRQMKTADHHFRGFPALWNVAAFYLFVLRPPPWVGAVAIAALAVLSFVPFKFVHPIRVQRWRVLNLVAVTAWALLAIEAVATNLEPGRAVVAALCALAVYFLCVGLLRPAS